MAPGSPGVAFEDPFHPQPDPFEDAPFLDSLDHIMGTGRLEPAFGSQQRRDGYLVETNGKNGYFPEKSHAKLWIEWYALFSVRTIE